jgi:hypothetical protein
MTRPALNLTAEIEPRVPESKSGGVLILIFLLILIPFSLIKIAITN